MPDLCTRAGLAHFYFHCGILHQDTRVELKDLGYACVVKGAGGWMESCHKGQQDVPDCLLSTEGQNATDFFATLQFQSF
jgi:hypothetical protein